MTTEIAIKVDIVSELAKELDERWFEAEIPADLIEKAKNNNLMIVFAKSDYSVYVYGAGGHLEHYQNLGELWFTENDVFLEPKCFEYNICKYFKGLRGAAKQITFFHHDNRQFWEAQTTDLEGEYFKLLHGQQIKIIGLVFCRDQLKHEYSDTELLDFLERLNKHPSGDDKTKLKKVGAGWSLINRRGKKAEGETSVRETIIEAIRGWDA